MENNGAGAAQSPRARNADVQRPDGTPVRVLVVDDEPSLAELLASVLRYEGWNVVTAGSGAEAVRTAREFRPDAVVLDIMLPDFNGLEVMRRLRAELPQVCVLFLTARDAVEDRVAGITAGGDDYVTKPFSLEEVLARLRGLLRRAGIARSRSDTELVVGDLTMDEDAREVRRGDELIELTAPSSATGFLAQPQAGAVQTDPGPGVELRLRQPGPRRRAYIGYLRKKIDVGRVPLIHTVRGVGYG
jgi:two-component system OmpR family response regulator